MRNTKQQNTVHQLGVNTCSELPFIKTIEKFYRVAPPSHFIEVTHELLHTYLEPKQDMYPDREDIQSMVLILGIQLQFLTELKENWEEYQASK